ncbi:lantibiotic dehydratase [Streptacidiphilus sp. MAP5-52]|uniref:lantibiotic dehydratase n=1 Tax=Streptacidiphilus sp. MAP5-52 TaxID=3156267 RepID=UPI0035147C68
MPVQPAYHWSGAAMLRASTYPAAGDFPTVPDPGDEADTDGARRWLEQVWGQPRLRESVMLASPVLAREIDRAVEGGADARKGQRLVTSLASYLLRWQRRPTPFGAFAGVCGIQVADRTEVAWGGAHQRVLRTDGAWTAGIISRLESNPALLERLAVMANTTATRRGDRIVVPGVPAGGDVVLMPPVEVSVNASAPVLSALERARTPITYSRLRTELADQFPTATAGQLDGLLTGLVEQQLLISALWPPVTTTDALGHVCTVLKQAAAAGLPDLADLVTGLVEIRYALGDPASDIPTLMARMQSLHANDTAAIMADTGLDAHVQVPEAVIREAQAAAGALVRLSAHPYGAARWRDYFARFRARYGPGAVVPVLDLVADSGLGLPADFLGASRTSAPRLSTVRDEKLLALIQQAQADGTQEIVLTDAMIADLSDGQDEPVAPQRVEVCVEVHATTAVDLDRGRFQLAVTGAPRPASSLAGRFLHLLTGWQREQWADSYRAVAGATAVQLSFAPRRRRDDVLARCQPMLPDVLALGEHQPAGPGVVALQDLAVTIDTQGFHLVRISTGRRLEPRVLHAIEAAKHTPPLARFLAELTTARCPVYTSFDFGIASRMPYLPGIRYRRTILAQPRWLLRPDTLPGRTAPTQDWLTALTIWRARWQVPDTVSLMEGEQRLPLDLSHPLDLRLLRSRVDTASRPVELRRSASPKDVGWIGQPHELLLALHGPAQPTPPRRRTVRSTTSPREPLLEGDHLLCAELSGHPERFDEILSGHLPALTTELDPAAVCWFLRHHDAARPDSDHQLHLLLSLPAEHHGAAVQQILEWSAGLKDNKLLASAALTRQQHHEGRFGHGVAVPAARAVFAADSAAALAQIRACTLAGLPTQALAAASMVDIAAAFGNSPLSGARQLVAVLPQRSGPADAQLLRASRSLADLHGPSAHLRSLPGGKDVAAAWIERAVALTRYREQLAWQRDPDTMLRSLLHQHHQRAVAADPGREQTTDRLARAGAMMLIAKRTAP